MAPGILREIVQSSAHLLLPQLCEGCRTPLMYQERVLCMSCTMELPQTGFHHIGNNAAALRLAGLLTYRHATAFTYFTPDGLLQHLLHRLKYSGRKSIGKFLGLQAGYALQAAPWIGEIDAIVPVPLHIKKERKRGYNQSGVISEGIAEVLGKPVLHRALARTRNTDSQTQKSRAERVLNVQDAFVAPGKDPFAGMHLLLIDDVLTTGATLGAAGAVLRAAPGVELSVCTIGLALH